VLSLPFAKPFVHGSSLQDQTIREAIYWVGTVLLLLYITLGERRSLTSVGFRRPTWRTFVFGVLAAVVSVAGILAMIYVVLPLLHLAFNSGAYNKLLAAPLWFRALLVLRAALFEELYYRGFAIERLSELLGARWIAELISFVAFTLAHVTYWGWSQLLIAGWGGAVLTLLYVWRRDVVCNMIAHFLADGSALLL
jgi:membrane protease YdiL (CAAX protease family)